MLVLSLVAKLHRNVHTRKALWRYIYQFLMGSYQEKDWTFSNYGYTPLCPDEQAAVLGANEEVDRSGIQMYHHVTNAVDLEGMRVLEVGSGRGGGSSYIKRYFRPRRMVGVDLSQNAVRFCTACHQLEGLSFIPADAESLPFRDGSFDAVLNVESSHCYPSMERFVGEVTRVLRPGGFFLFADFRPRGALEILERDLRANGLTVLRQTDITPNVLQALALDSSRKLQWIQRSAPRLMWFTMAKIVQEFWGVEGSRIHTAFVDGRIRYLSFVLQKGVHATAA